MKVEKLSRYGKAFDHMSLKAQLLRMKVTFSELIKKFGLFGTAGSCGRSMKNNGVSRKIVTVACIILYMCLTKQLYAQADAITKETPFTVPKYTLEFGPEYFWPIDRDRQIQTTSINVLKGKEYFEKIHVSLYAGMTLTYAWGHIVQLNQYLQDVKYNNSAYGIGPIFLIRWEPMSMNRLSLSLDASGGIILYSEDFPAGGDFYNFMWRIGPSLAYRIHRNYALILGYKWMHVSNGQGMTPQNPSYEGKGLSLHISRYF